MRIARTTGVSDTIVKVRRGISLRPKREEPKPPEKASFSIMTDWKVIQESTSAGGFMREVRALNDRLVQSMFVTADLISNGYRTANTDDVLDLEITYEMLEDMNSLPGGSRQQYTQMPVAFWRAVARQCGHDLPPHFTHVETYQNHSNRTFNVRFTTR